MNRISVGVLCVIHVLVPTFAREPRKGDTFAAALKGHNNPRRASVLFCRCGASSPCCVQ